MLYLPYPPTAKQHLGADVKMTAKYRYNGCVVGSRDARGLVVSEETGDFVYRVDRAGQIVGHVREADRVEAVLASVTAGAEAPWQCGDAIPVSPARGPVERFHPSRMVDDGKGGTKVEHDGYRGRDGARVSDVFDRMYNQAYRAHPAVVRAYDAETRKKRKNGEDVSRRKAPVFVPPFSWGQVQIARDYAALVERCSASGVKCSSLESLRQSSGTGGDREAAIFSDFARLRSMQRRIGDGLAKSLRRCRPSLSAADGGNRRSITVRHMVDSVCLAGLTPKEILQGAGWSGSAKQIRLMRSELCMALDRMQGYSSARPQDRA